MALKCTVIRHYRKNSNGKRTNEQINAHFFMEKCHQRKGILEGLPTEPTETLPYIKSEITEEEPSILYHDEDSHQTKQEPETMAIKTETFLNEFSPSHMQNQASSSPKKMVSRVTSISPRRLKKFEEACSLPIVSKIQKVFNSEVTLYQNKLEALSEKNRRNERKIINLESALAKLTAEQKKQPRFKVLKMVQIKKEK